ncbi:TAXI family TRAP transporter solute-binding subunit [Ahrensia sp. R2A130]|uniref:TAXI family TRAP transporter solute-binding subunit n=1 Tax=Ahrensia sp. R2A130 TaxID=744979 RepID=UPI0001E0CA4A|nr:TAXI family TRAP transporter solute-binding subunit [Ahrensia sp. R2A130]EFL87636.1 trap transporter solute receptor, taxi family protein [Ahrensia sp. R2A130]
MKHFAKGALAALALTTAIAAAPASAQDKAYTVSAGSISGSWFAIVTTMFETYRNNIDGLTYTTVPGGSVANPISVGGGQSQFGMSYSTNLFAAARGDAPYKAKIDNVRAIANTGLSAYMHIYVDKKLGVTSIREIADKNIALKVDTGPRGGGGELAAGRVLAAHGSSYDQIKERGGSITYSPYREAMDRVNDKQIDAFLNDDIPGAPLFAEFAAKEDILLLAQEPAAIKEMEEKYGYVPGVIPAGTYEGQTGDIATTYQTPLFITRADTDEEVVYQMTKLLFEKKDELVTGHNAFKALDINKAATGLTIPLHPGAERYYREVGVLK